MEDIRVVHMNGGTGEESYAKNSSLQRKAITIAKPIIEEAIQDVYRGLFPKTLCISDMGCSSGPNTFYAISQIMEAVDGIRRSLGCECPEFHIHLNDLPDNDFNAIFRSMTHFQTDLGCRVGPSFFTGVPGSFYGRLFPSKVLHFVHSSQSLHWLSRAPEEANDNKCNIYISNTSPSNVANAYLKQFTNDFSTFVRCRAIELVNGGCMVLTLVGRRLEDPGAWESQNVWGPLSITFKDMVSEVIIYCNSTLTWISPLFIQDQTYYCRLCFSCFRGLIEKEKLDSFNAPIYFPSVPELRGIIEEEGSFTVIRIGLVDVPWDVDDRELSTHDLLKNAGLDVAKTLRAAYEPLFASHFGEHIIDEVFKKSAENLSDSMSKEKANFCNVTISLRKKD